jgi:putative ABC transport system permease protein
VIPASRAGRLSAIGAITVGRAPQAGRGFRLGRALAATRLPLTVASGLSLPLARPGRALATVVAVAIGGVTLVFAVGLATSVHSVQADLSRTASVPVVVQLPREEVGGKVGPVDPTRAVDPAQVQASILAHTGTAHLVAVSDIPVSVAGVSAEVTVEAYGGDATWTGYPMITGRWYDNDAEVVAASTMLRQTGHHVGDRLVLAGPNGQRTVTVVGEVLDIRDDGLELLTDASTMSHIATVQPGRFEVGLWPGTDVATYSGSLQDVFGPLSGVFVDDRTHGNNERTFIVLQSLIATLAVLLCTVAALGVLNTAVLVTRERAHQIGVFKAIGMTPRQVAGLVLIGMAALGLVAGVLAVPAGILLQHRIVPVMAAGAGTGLPWSAIDVYQWWELAVLALAGAALAAVGALLPARWAARSRPPAILRAE